MVDLFNCMLIDNCQEREATIQDAVSRYMASNCVNFFYLSLHLQIISTTFAASPGLIMSASARTFAGVGCELQIY